MSDRVLPDLIEPLVLARSARALEGGLPVAGMPRLISAVRGAAGLVNVQLQFDIDLGGIPYVRGSATTDGIVMECQRCLREIKWPLYVRFELGLVKNEEQADRLPDHYEPLLVGDEAMSLSAIIEDELLLALPVAAMHDVADCPLGKQFVSQEVEEVPAPSKANPFAVLKALKPK